MTTKRNHDREALGAAVLIVALLLLARCDVRADTGRMDERLALARVCMGEAAGHPPDCEAIHQVLRSVQRRLGGRATLVDAAHAYSSRHFDPTRNDRRRWLADLWHDASEKPDGWPAVPPWQWMRPRWEAALEDAARILRERPKTCAEEPRDWGGDMDLERYFRIYPSARVVDCGDTLNTFLVPR